MFELFKNKKRLIRQKDYYKEHWQSEVATCKDLKRQLRISDMRISSLAMRNDELKEQNENLQLESTARLNMYNDEHALALKLKKKIESLESRNASLAEENRKLRYPKKEDHDPFIHE
jgi:cell division protein FtsB